MKIGMLGTGNLATSLGSAWTGAGHSIVLAGRSRGHAQTAARKIGPSASAVDMNELAEKADIVVVAVTWSGLTEALELAGAANGRFAGKTLIDCTNPLDFATARLLPESGSAAEKIALTAKGAHVVKALHMFAGASWPFTGMNAESPVVAICGDDDAALAQAATLVTALGARPAAVGQLDAARQLEEAAGFVTRIVRTGLNPRFAVPNVDPSLVAQRPPEK